MNKLIIGGFVCNLDFSKEKLLNENEDNIEIKGTKNTLREAERALKRANEASEKAKKSQEIAEEALKNAHKTMNEAKDVNKRAVDLLKNHPKTTR